MKFSPPLSDKEVSVAFKDVFENVTSIPDGIGGQGVVFKATAVGREAEAIALKIYFPGATPERTQREVNALKKISSSALVELHSSGKVSIRSETCLYVATRFIDGMLLSNTLMIAPLPLRQCAQLGRDVSLAICAMWQERIVHRDIKPTNLMLTMEGTAVLFDLGVARHLSMASLTSVGKTWGTMGYMSPEQARAMRQLSCKADLFSLGIVLQESLLGRHPAGHNQNLLVNGGPPTDALVKGVPVSFAALVDSIVAKEPHRRPPPDQVAQAFAKFI